MHITDYLHTQCIKVPLLATTKWEAIQELVETLSQHCQIGPTEAVFKRLRERETREPTFMVEFLALPHAGGIVDCIGTHVAIGKPVQPIDWERDDKFPTPAEFIALILSGGTKAELCLMMSRISEILMPDRVRDGLRRSSTREEVFQCISWEYDVAEQIAILPQKGVNICQELK